MARPGHRAPSSFLLSLGCLSAGMLAGWECSQQGFFPVRATDSSWSLGDSSPVGRGYRRDWLGGVRAEVGRPQLLCAWGPDLVPILSGRCKGGPARGQPGSWRSGGRPWGPETSPQQAKNMAGLILQALTSSSWRMHQEEVPPQIPSSGGAASAQTQVLWPLGTTSLGTR